MKKILFLIVLAAVLVSGCMQAPVDTGNTDTGRTTPPVIAPSIQPAPTPTPIQPEPTPEPEGCLCAQVYDPVCGVDGITYSNSCEAGCGGIDISFEGECVTEEQEAEEEAQREETEAEQIEELVFNINFDRESFTRYTDASENNYHAIKRNGVTTVAGFNADSNAARFNGRTHQLEIDNDDFKADLKSFTIMMWVNVDDLESIRSLFSRLNGHAEYPRAVITKQGAVELAMIVSSDSTKKLITGEGAVEEDTWIHIAISVDGDNENRGKVFLDGEFVWAKTFGEGTLNGGTNKLLIGKSNLGANFSGLMDDLRLYKEALSDSEIESIYDATKRQ
jgi:hypothetical protein